MRAKYIYLNKLTFKTNVLQSNAMAGQKLSIFKVETYWGQYSLNPTKRSSDAWMGLIIQIGGVLLELLLPQVINTYTLA